MHSSWSTFGVGFPFAGFLHHSFFVASSTSHPDLIRFPISADPRCVSQGCVAYSSESPRRRFAPSFTTSDSDGSDDKTRLMKGSENSGRGKPVEVW